MESRQRFGRPYRVSGADRVSGVDTEITIEAFDEGDATRTANRRGILVSACVAVPLSGTFCQVITTDPVVRKLLKDIPELRHRLIRLNDEDEEYFSSLTQHHRSISYRDSQYVARLFKDNHHLPRS
jgi:hypothetical protein